MGFFKLGKEQSSVDLIMNLAKNQEGLEPADLAALYTYLDSSKYQVNASLTRNCVDDGTMETVEHLDRILSKMKRYKGYIQKDVELGNDLDINQFMDGFEVGREVRFSAYLRFYTGHTIRNKKAQFILRVPNSKCAVDLTKVWHGEGEVLYPRGQRFIVKKVTSDSKYIYVDLAGIEETII